MKYKVTMSFGKETIISAEQRDKLKQLLSTGLDVLVEINDILVQGRDIRLVEPTKTADDYRLESQENMKRLMESREDSGIRSGRMLSYQQIMELARKKKENKENNLTK